MGYRHLEMNERVGVRSAAAPAKWRGEGGGSPVLISEE